MNADTFSKLASGLQNIAVIIGLAAGGWWSLKTFVFQNPAFYEQGFEVLGWDPEVVGVDMTVNVLDKINLEYELVFTLANNSKTLIQSFNPNNAQVNYFSLDNQVSGNGSFISHLPNVHVDIPTSGSRQVRYLVKFQKPALYLVEADFCQQVGKSCPFQKYIFVDGNAGG